MPDSKAVRVVAFVLSAALLAASCTTQAKKSEFFGKIDPPAGQVLRYITGSEPESLDPQMSSGQPEATGWPSTTRRRWSRSRQSPSAG